MSMAWPCAVATIAEVSRAAAVSSAGQLGCRGQEDRAELLGEKTGCPERDDGQQGVSVGEVPVRRGDRDT
jgi:hypothetical protein